MKQFIRMITSIAFSNYITKAHFISTICITLILFSFLADQGFAQEHDSRIDRETNTTFINRNGDEISYQEFLQDSPPINENDSLGLVDLYHALNGDQWNDNSGWLLDRVENWFGIKEISEWEHEDGSFHWHIERFALPDNSLSGFLPAEIGNIRFLREFEISNNEGITGDIPVEMMDLVELRRFWFDGTNISGPVNEETLEWLDSIEDVKTSHGSSLKKTFTSTESHVNVNLGIKNSFFGLSISFDEEENIDATFESVQWIINEEEISSEQNTDYMFPQGSSHGELIVTHSEEDIDTISFRVDVNMAHRAMSVTNSIPGLSFIGENLLFIPMDDGLMQVMDSEFDNSFDVSVGGQLRSVSSVSRDTVMYLSSTDRNVYSFDKFGIPQWSLPLGGDLNASPTVDEYRDRIYVGVSNRNIFGIDRTTGSVVWRSIVNAPVNHAGVMISEKYLLLVTDDGTMHIFNLDESGDSESKEPVVSLKTELSFASAPAIDLEGNIYLASTEGNIYKYIFDQTEIELSESWNYPSGAEISISPVIGFDSTIYIGNSVGSFHAINGDDGMEKWVIDLESSVVTTPTINNFGVIYVGTSGKLYAINESSDVIWSYETGSSISSSTAYTGSSIIFLTEAGGLYNVYDGWRYNQSSQKQTFANTIERQPQWGTYLGNYRRTGSNVDGSLVNVEEGLTNLPARFELHQNFPNPFNPSTQISYTVPSQTHILLEVYNILGQKVMTLVNEEKSAGHHEIQLDASNLSSGVYLYRLQAEDGFVESKQMLLLK